MENLEEKTDEELVTLSLLDKVYFSELIKRYEEKLRRYVRRITSLNDDHLDDVLQEVFIKTYINLNGFDKNLKFSSWIYRITHNEAISFYRKNKKHIEATYFYDDDTLETVALEISFLEEIHDKETRKSFMESIMRLDEKFRTVIILKFIEGKNYEEISDILKKPPGTIATWINRGKKKLREDMDKKGFTKHG